MLLRLLVSRIASVAAVDSRFVGRLTPSANRPAGGGPEAPARSEQLRGMSSRLASIEGRMRDGSLQRGEQPSQPERPKPARPSGSTGSLPSGKSLSRSFSMRAPVAPAPQGAGSDGVAEAGVAESQRLKRRILKEVRGGADGGGSAKSQGSAD